MSSFAELNDLQKSTVLLTALPTVRGSEHIHPYYNLQSEFYVCEILMYWDRASGKTRTGWNLIVSLQMTKYRNFIFEV